MATIEEKVKLLKELAGKAKKIKQKEQKRKAMQQDSIIMMRNIGSQPYRTFDNQSIDDIRQNQINRSKQIQLDSIRNIRENANTYQPLTQNLKTWKIKKTPANIALNDYPDIKQFRDEVVNSDRKTFTQNEIDFYNANKRHLPKNYDIEKYDRELSQRTYENKLGNIPLIGGGLKKIAQGVNFINTPIDKIGDIIQGKTGERIATTAKAVLGADDPNNYTRPDLGNNISNTAADIVGSLLGYIGNPGGSISLGQAGLQSGQGVLSKLATTKGGQLASKGFVKLDKAIANKLPKIIQEKYPQIAQTVRSWASEGVVSTIPISTLETRVQVLNAPESIKKITFDSLAGGVLDVSLRGAGKTIPYVGKKVGQGILNKTGIADELKFGETADIAGRGGISDTVDIYKLKKSPEIKAKTSTKNYKFKNVEAEKAWKNYDEAIETIQNHYGTYELRQSEVNSIKDDLGIDLDKLIKNIEKAENLTTKQIAERAKYQRVVGLGNKKVEKIRSIASGKNKLVTNKELKEKFSYKNNKEKIVNNDYSKEAFNKRYNLDKDISKLSESEKANFEKEIVNKMLKDSGKRISKKIESYDPKQAVKYYSEKYKFADEIKVDDTLQGSKNIAELTYKKDSKGNLKDFTIKYNKNISDDDIVLGAVRHELEHYRDIKAGYESPKDFMPNQKANTLSKIYEGGKHNKYYDWFEPEYLRRSEIKEALSKGEKIDKAILDELNIDSSKINKIDEISSQNLKGENIPNEKINKINNEISSIKNKMNQKNISQEEYSNLRDKLNTEEERLKENLKLYNDYENPIELEDIGIEKAPQLQTEDIKTSFKDKTKKAWDIVYNRFVNNNNYVDKTGKAVKQTAANYSKYNATVDYIINNNMVDRLGLDVGDKSLKSIMDIKNLDEFDNYLAHYTNLDRIKLKKGILTNDEGKLLTLEENQKIIDEYEKNFPEIKETKQNLSKLLDDFSDNWLKDIVSEEDLLKMRKAHPNWIPAPKDFRNVNVKDFKSNTLRSRPIKYAVGGTEKIIPPHVSIPMYFQKIVRASRRNDINLQILKSVSENPEKFKNLAEIYKIDKEFKLKDSDLTNVMDNIDEGLRSDGKGGDFLDVYIDGKPITLKINDKNFFNNLKKFYTFDISRTDEMLNIIRKYWTNNQKALITGYNPFFPIRNTPRDLASSYIFGKTDRPDKFIANNFSAMWDMLKDTKLANKIFKSTAPERLKQYKAVGGSGHNLTNIEQIFKGKGWRKPLKITLDFLNSINKFSENLPRYQEFKSVYNKSIKKGLSKEVALREANYASGEVTVNFGRHGDYTKALDAVYMYLNPRVQGLDRAARSTLNRPLATIVKALGVVTAPTFIFHQLNRSIDKEGYDNAPNWAKDNYYLISKKLIGGKSGEFFRVPKAQVFSALFGSFFERLERMYEGDPDAFKELDKTVIDQFLPLNPLKGDILSPAKYLESNQDYFNRPIIPEYLVDVEGRLQFDEKTTELAKLIGDKTNLSPMQIDFLSKNVLGFISSTYQGLEPTVLGKENGRNFFDIAGLTVDSNKQNKQVTNFYEYKKEINSKIESYDKEYELSKIRKNTKSTKLEKIKINSALGAEASIYNKLKSLKKEIDKSNTKMKEFRDEKDLESVNEEAKKMNEKINKLKSLIKK